MGKLPENYEDWRHPWTAEEFDSERAAKLVFNARKAEEKAKEDRQAEVTGKDAEIAQLKTDLEDVKASKAGTDEDAQDELKTLRKENTELKSAAEKHDPAAAAALQSQNDQLKVALALGLDLEDAERLRGKDYDELLADGKDFAKRHGIEVTDDDGGSAEPDPETGGSQPPQQRPTPNLRTGFENGGRIVPSNPKTAAEKLPALF